MKRLSEKLALLVVCIMLILGAALVLSHNANADQEIPASFSTQRVTVYGPVFVDGAYDTIQIKAQGYTTQTNPMLALQTSAGASKFSVDVDGNVDVRGSVSDGGGTLTFGDNAQVTGTLDLLGVLSDSGGALVLGDATQITSTLDVLGAVGDSGGVLTFADDASITGTLSVGSFSYTYIDSMEVTTDTLATIGQRSTWFWANAGTGITLTLPAAVEGLSYCAYNYDGADLYIDVQSGDQIFVLTNATGDRITNTTAGNSVCLLAIGTTNWVATAINGTWSDAD
jgi:hypothetical protein